MTTEPTPGGLRERTRRAVRAELSRLAVELFTERGFEQTTVEDIAEAAGLSKRSFFRYFPSKEDAAFGDVDLLGEQVAAELRSSPLKEPPWDSLHRVLRNWSEEIYATEAASQRLKLIESTPALHARLQHKRERLRHEIGAALCDRPHGTLSEFEADLLTGAAAAALDAASREAVRNNAFNRRQELVDRAFCALRPALADD